MGFFGNVKKRFEKFEDQRSMKKANELKDLRKKRLKLEGRAKINVAHDRESLRIKKAKKKNFDSSFLGRVVKSAQKVQKRSKSKKKTEHKINPAFSLGGK